MSISGAFGTNCTRCGGTLTSARRDYFAFGSPSYISPTPIVSMVHYHSSALSRVAACVYALPDSAPFGRHREPGKSSEVEVCIPVCFGSSQNIGCVPCLMLEAHPVPSLRSLSSDLSGTYCSHSQSLHVYSETRRQDTCIAVSPYTETNTSKDQSMIHE